MAQGKLEIINIPDTACFSTFAELLRALPIYLGVEVPDDISNVIISNIQPLDADRTKVWFRQDNSGKFVGIYLFSGGTWVQLFPPPQGIFRLYGDSNTIPTGYELITNSTVGFTTGMVAAVQADWIRDPTDTFWVVFDVIYNGI